MHSVRLKLLTLFVLLMLAPLAAHSAVADEQAELERTLHAFLAGANEREVHETFWAEDLIYTGSSGARFGKAAILAGFDEVPETDEAVPTYGGEDVTIRVYGELAVVTFRLTADQDGVRIGEYFNTGVFRKEGETWKAFTWQATRIPEQASE